MERTETNEMIRDLRGINVDVRSAAMPDCTYILGQDFFQEVADRLEELQEKVGLLEQANLARSEYIKEHLMENESRSAWNSVEDDKKPKDGEKIYTYNKEGRMKGYYYSEKHGFSNDVTHWMYYPAPPKPKEPTFKDKFLEMFPKAELNNFGVPVVCAGALFLYLRDSCNNSDCYYNSRAYQEKCCVCWNRPYFEEEGGE